MPKIELKTKTSKKHIHSKRVVLFGIALILVGVIGLSYPFWPSSLVSTSEYVKEVAQAFDLEAQRLTSEDPSYEYQEDDELEEGVDPVLAHVSNRLYIPSIDVDMPLIEGDDVAAIELGGWVFPGTARPNDNGNSVIVGHQFRYRPPLSNTFFNLHKLEQGDIYSVVWEDKTYTYKVKETKIVEPTEVSVLDPTDESQMTLITCYPAFSVDQRLVVVGDLVVVK